MPCKPSMTCGPLTPKPSRNRPPDRWASVMAVCAIVTGERVPSWITPEPSSMDSVRAARYPSTEGASAPQASATHQTSRPSFSASTANSTVFLPAAELSLRCAGYVDQPLVQHSQWRDEPVPVRSVGTPDEC